MPPGLGDAMGDEIEGIGERRRKDEPLEWTPWQPPPWILQLQQQQQADATDPAEDTGVAGVGATGSAVVPRMAADSFGTKGLDWAAVEEMKPVNLEALGYSLGADAAEVLGQVGVVGSLGQVALAFTRTPLAFDEMASSLGAFAERLSSVSAELLSVPVVGEALLGFGGVSGVVAGAVGFQQQLAAVEKEGAGLSSGLGLASKAAQFVGGVATALGVVCAPLAPIGASIMAASAAFELGRLAWDNRDALKAGARAAGQAVQDAAEQVSKVVSNGGAQMAAQSVARIVGDMGSSLAGGQVSRLVSNNGAMMTGGPQQAFAWMTG